MGDSETAQREIGEERLNVTENGAAGGGVAGVADSRKARQAVWYVAG